jgi:hypothetical protein
MIIFIQGAVVGFALFILLISISKGKLPTGLVEWMIIIAAFIIMVSWSVKY